MNQDRTTNKANTLAGEVLTLSRNTLLVNLRFLDAALSQFLPEVGQTSSVATDGQMLYYDTLHVLRAYREEHAAPARNYLHLVLHCVLRHMFNHKNVEPDAWDLACDIAVEHAISGFGLKAVTVEREHKQQEVCETLSAEIGMLTAEKIYRYLLGNPFPPEQLDDVRALFFADDHQFWYTDKENELAFDETEKFWKGVSLRMQVDMETFARRQGDKARAMMQNLREANRETYDYAGFLRKFAARGEVMKTDPEEFDYIFYTYGMSLYDKMPLIEPVEYKDVKKVREFVLAVDLSGLIDLEQARRFLRKTYGVLQAAESKAVKNRLHILTCDGVRVEHTAITGAEAFEAYLDGLVMREREETDYRPAFLWLDEMVEKQAFRNLKGMLYFTDGLGAFPKKKPAYEAAFVFVNDNYSEPAVPPWAIRLVLQKEELNEYEQ